MQLKYQEAKRRKEKSRILTEVCENLGGCRRKHAVRLLNGPLLSTEQPSRQRDSRYPERLIRVLAAIGEASQH